MTSKWVRLVMEQRAYSVDWRFIWRVLPITRPAATQQQRDAALHHQVELEVDGHRGEPQRDEPQRDDPSGQRTALPRVEPVPPPGQQGDGSLDVACCISAATGAGEDRAAAADAGRHRPPQAHRAPAGLGSMARRMTTDCGRFRGVSRRNDRGIAVVTSGFVVKGWAFMSMILVRGLLSLGRPHKNAL